MYARRVGPLPDSGRLAVTQQTAGDHHDRADERELIGTLTQENSLLSRRLERERRIRHEAEEIAEKGLRDLYHRQKRLEMLSALAQQLSAALTPQDIGTALSEHVLNAAGATALSLGLVDSARGRLEWVTAAGFAPGAIEEFAGGLGLNEQSVSTDAVRSGRPIAMRTSTEHEQTYPEQELWSRRTGAESTVGWPLTAGGTHFGVLLLVWAEPQPLDIAQRTFISAVATMVSQSLVRARFYSDENARAAVLQAAVLPDSPTQISGLDICVTYEPADASHGLGGDWYDVMPLPGKRAYIAVGDVVGHGLSAVEDMAQLRAAGRALAHHGLLPAALLAELNGFTRDASHGKFATMAVAIFDQNNGSLAYCTAGHPPPLFRRAATGEVSRLADAHGPVLGPLRDAAYTESALRVGSGDIMVMYTDGLVEGRNLDIETGIGEAERTVADWNPVAETGLNCALLTELLSTRHRADDVCVTAVRFIV